MVSTSAPITDESSVCLKFLVSNTAAGAIIGKEGANLVHFQKQHDVRMTLTGTGANFPMTGLRVCSIYGSPSASTECLGSVLAPDFEDPKTPDEKVELKLVVPVGCVGCLIGKKGSGIQNIVQQTGASVRVANTTSTPSEVLCPVSGTKESVLHASRLILERLQTEPKYQAETHRRISYPVMSSPSASRSPISRRNIRQQNDLDLMYHLWERVSANPTLLQSRTKVHIPVRGDLVGAIIGKSGRRIADVRSQSGATVSIQDTGENEEATVAISGSLPSVFSAIASVIDCIDQASQ
ncbi:MAG: hypothetical protein KVP17_003785 [Porospora cf. gigantea B]|uniref:uncharacterized protein n=1 Tax=Porospora cf. gigantea B TaxID=2853592 RepID=UPI003571B1BF|nr:MAG: hypothetical protein KVP17_003785 [Porospora cf. gigantea B]